MSQVNHWFDFAATAIDLLLLLRVLTLKLHRTYFFIALACLLVVFAWFYDRRQARRRAAEEA